MKGCKKALQGYFDLAPMLAKCESPTRPQLEKQGEETYLYSILMAALFR